MTDVLVVRLGTSVFWIVSYIQIIGYFMSLSSVLSCSNDLQNSVLLIYNLTKNKNIALQLTQHVP